MPEYVTPGVFVQEVSHHAPSIAGVDTSTTLFLGETERGPLGPRLVTSLGEFDRFYERSANADYTYEAAVGFFQNGGKRLVVARLCGDGSVVASLQVGRYVLEAIGPGAWGNRIWVRTELSGRGLTIRAAYFEKTPDAGLPAPFEEGGPTPDLEEEFGDIPVGDAASLAGYFTDSALLRIHDAAEPVETPEMHSGWLAGGLSLPAELANVEQALIGSEANESISLVYRPDAAPDVARLLVDHCERRCDRFCVLDGRHGSGLAGLNPRLQYADSAYAAFYHPWIEIVDGGQRKLVPAGGHVLGIYARVDSERGVFRAPATETVRGAIGLDSVITAFEQEEFNPLGVNAIRRFEGKGILLWGARTLSSDGEWKYVAVRRYLIYLETSIVRGLRWAVFEPDDERLWIAVRDTVSRFLLKEWRSGGIQGDSPDKAFFVKCDRSTMSPDDILNGRLICEVGVAMVVPAEFIIFKIGPIATQDTVGP